jgi:hypothetical protein
MICSILPFSGACQRRKQAILGRFSVFLAVFWQFWPFFGLFFEFQLLPSGCDQAQRQDRQAT